MSSRWHFCCLNGATNIYDQDNQLIGWAANPRDGEAIVTAHNAVAEPERSMGVVIPAQKLVAHFYNDNGEEVTEGRAGEIYTVQFESDERNERDFALGTAPDLDVEMWLPAGAQTPSPGLLYPLGWLSTWTELTIDKAADILYAKLKQALMEPTGKLVKEPYVLLNYPDQKNGWCVIRVSSEDIFDDAHDALSEAQRRNRQGRADLDASFDSTLDENPLSKRGKRHEPTD